MISLSTAIILVSIFQFIFFSCFLLTTNQKNQMSNRLLAIFLLAKTMTYIPSFIHSVSSAMIQRFPIMFYGGIHFKYILGPALFFYTKSIVHPFNKIRRKDTLHLIPFLAHILVYAVFFYLQDTETRHTIIQTHSLFTRFGYTLDTSAYLIHFIIYAVLSLGLLHDFRIHLKNYFSAIGKMKFYWLSIFIVCFITIWLLFLFREIAWWLNLKFLLFDRDIIFISNFLFINMIFFWSLKRPEIHISEETSNILYKKYQNSPLTETMKETYRNKILSLMQNQKPFLEPDLTLINLAKMIPMSSKHLSQIINEQFECNFYDFVNGYRIEEAKKRILKEDYDLNITQILYDVGYNSKSVFYSAFKKRTGMTPVEFRRSSIPNLN